MAQPNLDDVARRSQKYWDVDGLPELMMGLLWVLWGGALVVGEALPRDWRANAFWTAVPALLVVSGVAAIWATKRLKQRLTFPRTGYVDWKEPSRSARVVAAGVAMVTAMVLAAVATNRDTSIEQAAATLLGVILTLALVVASLRQRAPHYLALAGVALALGLAFSVFRAGSDSVNWMFVALGAASAALGSVRLVLFLKKHPRAASEG